MNNDKTIEQHRKEVKESQERNELELYHYHHIALPN